MNNTNCNCNTITPCGSETVINCGCKVKQDLLCTVYTGPKLLPLNIEPGTDGNTVIKTINDHIQNLSGDGNGAEPLLIESVGGKADIYQGVSTAYIHQIRSIQGEEGVIVEVKGPADSCDTGNFINVRIDKDWIKNHILNLLVNEFDLCDLISGCGTVPIPNDAPTTADLVFNIPNRSTKIFTGTDFTFNDPDGDAFSAVRVTGNVVDYKLNDLPYTADDVVTVGDIQLGKFKFVGQDTDLAYQNVAQFKVRDSQGSWSSASLITMNVAAKVIVQLQNVSLSFLRGATDTKTATVSYTNGNGQTLTAGQVLYTTGTVGQPGYIRVYVQANTVLTSVGTFNVVVVSYPYETIAGNPASITYNIDGGNGIINLTYMSAPENDDVNLDTEFLQPIPFTTAMLTAAISDLDNDAQQIRINPSTPDNLNGYFYNGIAYGGQWIDIADIGNITFIPDNIPAGYTKSNVWEVKDSQGNISI